MENALLQNWHLPLSPHSRDDVCECKRLFSGKLCPQLSHVHGGAEVPGIEDLVPLVLSFAVLLPVAIVPWLFWAGGVSNPCSTFGTVGFPLSTVSLLEFVFRVCVGVDILMSDNQIKKKKN